MKLTAPRGAVYLLSALTALPMLCLLWAAPVVPSHDGPEHLAAVVLWRGLQAGASPMADHLLLNPTAMPRLQTWFLGLLWDPLGPIAAQKLFLTLYLLGLPLAASWLRRGLERDPTPSTGLLTGLLASMLGPSWCFFMGFFDFLAAIPLVLLATGVWARHLRSPSRFGLVLLALVLPVTALTHPVGLAVATALALLMALTSPGRARALGHLAVASATGWLVLGLTTWRAGSLGLDDAWPHPPLRLPPSDVLGGLVNFTVGGPTASLYILAGPLLACLGLTLWAARSWRGTDRHAAQGVALGAVAMAAVYALAPFHAARWSFVQPRFGLLTLLLFACLAGLDWLRGARLAVVLAAAITPLVAFAPFVRSYLRAADDIGAVARAAEHVPAGSLALPLVFEPESAWADPWQRPLEYAGSYVTVFTGSVTPYPLGVSAGALFRPGRPFPDHPPLYAGTLDGCLVGEPVEECILRRRRFHDQLVFQMRSFDAALLWRPPPELLFRLEQRGAEVLYEDGGAVVVAPRVGAVQLRFDGAPADRPIVAQLLAPESEEPLLRGAFPAPPRQAESREVTMGPLLAGRYVLRVAADLDDNGQIGPLDAPALGGTGPGQYVLFVRPDQILVFDVTWQL